MSADQILKKGHLLLVIGVFLISACQPENVTSTFVPVTETHAPTQATTPTQKPTITIQPTHLTATPTITEQILRVCSPLEGETLETLSSIIVNPLAIPTVGRDDGHHGVDFAYYRRGERESIQGIEVYAIISGKSVLTLENNIPYGFTVLVETPLSDLPENLQDILSEVYQPIPEDVDYQGECPQINQPGVTGELSLYHLYAHLEQKPAFSPGDPVPCGAILGTVGNTGRSSNPHLHLETRLGPANATLEDMAFYETIYTEEQRANYCLWRMSGYFQLVDPFLLFEHGE